MMIFFVSECKHINFKAFYYIRYLNATFPAMGSSVSISQIATEQDVHVVVIGAGYGGIHCARALQKEGIAFTIVEPKEFFHHNVAALRAAVRPGEISKSLVRV